MPGKCVNQVDDVKITDASGKDVSKYYDVTIIQGMLIMYPPV